MLDDEYGWAHYGCFSPHANNKARAREQIQGASNQNHEKEYRISKHIIRSVIRGLCNAVIPQMFYCILKAFFLITSEV